MIICKSCLAFSDIKKDIKHKDGCSHKLEYMLDIQVDKKYFYFLKSDIKKSEYVDICTTFFRNTFKNKSKYLTHDGLIRVNYHIKDNNLNYFDVIFLNPIHKGEVEKNKYDFGIIYCDEIEETDCGYLTKNPKEK